MYQRYWGGNMDEGWTRLLLEQFSFPYRSIMDAEIRKGGLNAAYDVIILPEDSTAMITGERSGERAGARTPESYPPEYRSGIGSDGVSALKEFVTNGGTLVALGGASVFAIDKFGLSVRNVVAGRTPKEFWCPGSTLKVSFDTSHPLAHGMPAQGLAVYLGGNPVFEILPSDRNDDYETVVRYAGRELLQSGWLIGEDVIARKGAVVQAKVGKGKAVLYGIRPQHRAQTHATFKLFFNALMP
jgi:hypothetical protein